MAGTTNVFVRLHRWAVRQDENFLTESLAIILEMLFENAPSVGARLVATITNGFISVDTDSLATLEVQTQVTTVEGRPDLEIRMPERLAVFEVKSESEVRRGQLEGYREYLRSSQCSSTLLVLLAKYPPSLPADAEQPDLVLRWYEVADSLERELAASSIEDPVCRFPCEQFFQFLKERNMTITQVSWQLSQGSRDMRSFLVMLQEAAKACQVSATKDLSLEHVGFKLEGGKYWFGLDLTEPNQLWFGVNQEAAQRLAGDLESEGWVLDSGRWWRGGDLESEQVHFYHRSKVGQIQWLEQFLRECLNMARQIEVPYQPPVPPGHPEE